MAFENPSGIDLSGPSSHVDKTGTQVSWDPESKSYVPTASIGWTKYGLTNDNFWSKYGTWIIGIAVFGLLLFLLSKYYK